MKKISGNRLLCGEMKGIIHQHIQNAVDEMCKAVPASATVPQGPKWRREVKTILVDSAYSSVLALVAEAAFAAVFKAQDEGKLQWKPREKRKYRPLDVTAEITVKDSCGIDIVMPVVFFVELYDQGFFGEFFQSGHLCIGNKDRGEREYGDTPLILSTGIDERVQRLYKQLTGKTWSDFA